MEWDRGDDWEVQHICETRRRVRVRVVGLVDLMRIRQLMASLRDLPPAQVREQVKDGVVDLGEFGCIEGAWIAREARALGLPVEVESRSLERHEPFNRTRNIAPFMDDAEDRERLAAEMLAAGVRLVQVEID